MDEREGGRERGGEGGGNDETFVRCMCEKWGEKCVRSEGRSVQGQTQPSHLDYEVSFSPCIHGSFL